MKKKLKIGLMTEWFAPETGGGETHLIELGEWLVAQGHEVHMLLGERIYQKYMETCPRAFPFKVHRIRLPMRRHFKSRNRKFRTATWWSYFLDTLHLNGEAIQKLGLDILHGHSFTTLHMAIVLGRVLRIPSIATLHLNFFTLPSYRCAPFCEGFDAARCLKCRKVRLPWLKKQKEAIWDIGMRSALASGACRILTLSTRLKKDLARYNGLRKNVSVLPNWVRFKRFRVPKKNEALLRKYGLKPSDKVILYVGRIYWIKGIEYLVDAMPAILRKHPDCKLLIAGRLEHLVGRQDTYNRRMHELVRRHGLSNRVVFTGNLDYRDMPGIYGLADILVHPSFTETQGLVLLEAMAAKLPIVTTRIPTVREFLKHERNALLVKRRNSKAIAREVNRLLDDPALARQLAQNAYRTVRERFDAARILPRLMKIYREEIDRCRRGASAGQ